jgi:hypothetical protein
MSMPLRTSWTDTLFIKLQTLLGERGERDSHAVRFRDLDQVYAEARRASAGAATLPGNINEIISTAIGTTVQEAVDAEVAVINAALDAGLVQIADFSTALDASAMTVANLSAQTTALTAVADALAADLNAQITTLAGNLSVLDAGLDGQIEATTIVAGRVSATEGNISALTTTQQNLSATVNTIQDTVQGFRVTFDALGKLAAGAAGAVATNAAALGQAATLRVTEGATARSFTGTTNGAYVLIPATVAAIFAGQRVKIGVLAYRAASNFSARFGIAYSAGAAGNSGFLNADRDIVATPQWYEFFYTVPFATAVSQAHYIGIFADTAKLGRSIVVAKINVEIAAVAGELPEIATLTSAVSAEQIARANGDSALATSINTVSTSVGGIQSTVIAQSSAISSLQGNAAASFVLRVGAGGASAGLELVAADNPISGPASTIRMKADSILLDGTVGVKTLLVSDFTNLVLNPIFSGGSLDGWVRAQGVTQTLQDTSAPSGWVMTLDRQVTIETSRTYPANFNEQGAFEKGIPLKAGDQVLISALVRAFANPFGANVRLEAVTLSQAGSIAATIIGNSTNGNWTTISGVFAATIDCALFVRVQNIVNNSFARVGRVEVRRRNGGELVIDGSLTGDKIQARSLSAASIAVGTLTAEEIVADGITRQGVSGSGLITNNSTTYTTVTSFTIPQMPTISYLQGLCSFALTQAPAGLPANFEIRVVVNGQTPVALTAASAAFMADNDRAILRPFTIGNLPAGDIVVMLQMRNMGGNGITLANLSAVAAMR